MTVNSGLSLNGFNSTAVSQPKQAHFAGRIHFGQNADKPEDVVDIKGNADQEDIKPPTRREQKRADRRQILASIFSNIVPSASALLFFVNPIVGLLGLPASIVSGKVGHRIKQKVDYNHLSEPYQELYKLDKLFSDPEKLAEKAIADGDFNDDLLKDPEAIKEAYIKQGFSEGDAQAKADALNDYQQNAFNTISSDIIDNIILLGIPVISPIMKFAFKTGPLAAQATKLLTLRMNPAANAARAAGGKGMKNGLLAVNAFEVYNKVSDTAGEEGTLKALWVGARETFKNVFLLIPTAMITAGKAGKGKFAKMLQFSGWALNGLLLLTGLIKKDKPAKA